MNSLEEMIYRVIAESDGLNISEISSLIEEDKKKVKDTLSNSMTLNTLVKKDSRGKWHLRDYRSYLDEQFRADPELLLIVKRIIDNPELKSLFDTTNILKTNEIDSVLEYSEWSQAKGDKSKYNEKRFFPRFRRIDINWEKLQSSIESRGYSIWSLAKEFGISTHIFYASKRDNKMNPFLLEELCDFINADVNEICEDFAYSRVRNGVSHERRVKVNWKLLVKDAQEKGYDMHELSRTLGKSSGYLMTCRAVDGINEDVLRKIGDLLNRNYRDYFDNRKESLLKLVDEACDKYNI